MRKEAKQAQDTTIARVQSYHEGGYHSGSREQYAVLGYDGGFYLFTSDRKIQFADDLKTLVNGKLAKGYGLEIETECNSITDDTVLANIYKHIIFPHFPTNLFKMQHDGSLNGRSSAECITQPMTKEAIRNNYSAFQAMYNVYFPAFNISCVRTGNCGMHVNISTACFGSTEATQEEAIRKLFYIINRNFRLFANLFNRDENNTGYCAAMRYTDAKTMDLHSQSCSHGVCFNLGHYDAGRIEIRLVGGQKDYACFRNTMETIFHLVERVKKISWKQCEECDMVSLFKGCNQYVLSRLNSHALRRGLMSQEIYDDISASVQREELL